MYLRVGDECADREMQLMAEVLATIDSGSKGSDTIDYIIIGYIAPKRRLNMTLENFNEHQ